MRWVVLLSLFFYLIGLVVSAINTPFLGIITMRSFGGTIGGIVRLAFLVGAVCLSLYAMQYLFIASLFHIIAASGR